MPHVRNRPSSVILDLLRSTRSRRYSAGALIDAGALFGFAENTIRVTLSRLLARGIIESPERGLYRLSGQTDALNDFVERWRLGESRVRDWEPGRWLFAHGSDPDARSTWALEALGFRELRPSLLVRPDNLALTLSELRTLAAGIGLDASVLLVSGEPEGDPVPAGWPALWQPGELEASYADSAARLEASARRLHTLPPGEARLECFTLGGETIHRLAKDPLLPAQLIDSSGRDALTRAMLDYDVLGKEIWAAASNHEHRHMPRPQMATAS